MKNTVSASFTIKKIGRKKITIGDFRNSRGVLSGQPDMKMRVGDTMTLDIPVEIIQAPKTEPEFIPGRIGE